MASEHYCERMGGEPEPDSDTDNSVGIFGCPSCGEDDCDRLVWQDDETVACQRCGNHYKPNDTNIPLLGQ